MFKKIADLFSNFFSSLFGNRSTPAPKPTTERPTAPRPGGLAEDSSDVPVDTVTTVNVQDVDIPDFNVDDSGPFADKDKDKAFEEGNTTTEPPVVVIVPPVERPREEPPKPGGGSTARKPKYLWCLDNGHGKLQAGKRSPKFKLDGKETQFFEYEFNRDIVERIIKALDKEGVKYYDIVPDYLEVGSFLSERVDRANKKKSDLPKIYVSVHANAGPSAPGSEWANDSIRGIETWYAHNSTKGKKIAAVFQKCLIAKTGFHDRKLRSTKENSLYVLVKTTMPAVLTENGFFNNEKEVLELMKSAVRQKIADAHVAAILEIEKNGIE